jgi:hypothetical protein
MKPKSKEIFIEQSKSIYGDLYDYSLVIYKNSKTKIKLICKEHGVFEQYPHHHLCGKKCFMCVGKNKTTEIFTKEAKKLHGELYDYSLTEYKKSSEKVKIICKEHGVFLQSPDNHLRGYKCNKCLKSKKLTTEEFIKKAIKKHENKYNYSLVDYINSKTKINIICNLHGIFEQEPSNHLYGNGCQKCVESKGESKIRNYLFENKVKFETEKIFKDCKSKLALPFDFYLSELNICIEYDGIQHFEPIEIWGGVKTLIEQQKRDEIKNIFCIENKIRLVRISYKQNINKELNKLCLKK